MRALVLNDVFSSWSGSEIVALEVAEHFQAVTSSFHIAEPMRSMLPEWRPLEDIDLRQFDFVWAQHHTILPLLDRLCEGERRPFIAFVTLSPYEPNERPLASMLEAYGDAVIANSTETASILNHPKTLVFRNAAPAPFHFARKETDLHHVLIVSNVVPTAVLGAAKILRRRGIGVHIIGQGFDFRRLSPDDIRSADVVVTIGKTARYALASGTPVYLYDRFGGDGYLTPENYSENEHFNFSGRPRCRRISADEIAAEIYSGYRWWTPPPQPKLGDILNAIMPIARSFSRHPDLAGAAAMAVVLGNWIAASTGDTGSWSWLAMCLRKKMLRVPSEIREKLSHHLQAE